MNTSTESILLAGASNTTPTNRDTSAVDTSEGSHAVDTAEDSQQTTTPPYVFPHKKVAPSDLMAHFFSDFVYFEAPNMKGQIVPKWSGVCKLCSESKQKQVLFKDTHGTTSNFCSHLRAAHALEYSAYQQTSCKSAKAKNSTKGQGTITAMFSKDAQYSKTDPQQIKITESYVDNLVINAMLPIYTCETKGFRDFMMDANCKWRPCSGKWVSRVKLPQKHTLVEAKLQSVFANLED